MSCLDVSDRLMYSASVEDRVIVFCFFETQLTGAPANFTGLPVTNFLVVLSAAQSASAYAMSPSLFLPLYVIVALSVELTYLIIWRDLLICSSDGFVMN